VPDYEDRLSKFERMAVVKAFREDRALLAAADVIADALGPRFVEGAPLSMERAWAESRPRAPLICLLSPGSDPTRLIEELAKRRRVKTLGVSMGQGQEVIARKYVAAAAAEGQWVLLQNAHLGLGYLNEVEAFLAKADALHDDFRLWITAEPHPAFPIGLLQMGIKITNEAPVGLRAGLRASYQAITQDALDAVPRREWRQLLFVTCFLHSVVQERRKFGPIGWNVPYEFNASDLAAATTFLQGHLADMDAKRCALLVFVLFGGGVGCFVLCSFLKPHHNQQPTTPPPNAQSPTPKPNNSAPGPTWETVRYMVSVIQYGGRITDDFDQALMDAYAERYFHQGVLAPNCELARDDRSGFVYRVPDAAEVEGFRGAIEALPAGESPEVFGLHANADLTFRTLQVREAVSTILDTMPKGGGGGGGLSREEAVNRLCEDLLAKVPPPFDNEDVRDKLKRLPGGPTQPLTVHLRQEVDRLNAVLVLARATLADLRLAIAGTIALSGPLIDALDALALARIPPAWLRASWEAATLGAWFAGLLQRHDQLARWLTLGRPKSFWLPGFFNPQGFLTAVKQEVARHHAADKWALDDVVMSSEVTHPPRDPESLREAPAEGVYIHGLCLDGAAWSGRENRLVDAEPKKLHCPLPVLHVTGVLAKDRKLANVYEAPCYRVKARRGNNFIATFGLRTEDDKSKWVLRGVALLCSVD
jgi:dynein heavy chain